VLVLTFWWPNILKEECNQSKCSIFWTKWIWPYWFLLSWRELSSFCRYSGSTERVVLDLRAKFWFCLIADYSENNAQINEQQAVSQRNISDYENKKSVLIQCSLFYAIESYSYYIKITINQQLLPIKDPIKLIKNRQFKPNTPPAAH